MRITLIYISFILFVFSTILYSQGDIDSCNREVDRILNTYRRLENKYIEAAKEKLLFFISHDSVLTANFLNGDSSNYKNLMVKLSPTLKLDYQARNFNYGENICKYFVFDTLTYDCYFTFYLNNRSVFTLSSQPSPCECGVVYPGGLNLSKEEKYTGKFFGQSIYKDSVRNNYSDSFFYQDTSSDYFYFSVDGLDYGGLFYFYIYDSKIYVDKGYLDNQNSINVSPSKFIESFFNEEWIRYCAKRCSIGEVPWWRFWDWGIFLKKPDCEKKK